MNEDSELLKKEGWILSESGLKTIDLKGSARKNISKVLLDRDLREIGAGISDLHKGKFENIEHDLVVLQILKLRNISAPKSNEMSKTAPKLMKLQLTDGQNTYSAIEMEPTALSLETRPGTKISLKVKQLKYANGQLLLTPKNMDILGGYVESLVSKWEISRSLATQMKGNRSGTAPPFIPFGQKIQQNLPNDRSFKSLQQSKTKDGEENSEFNAQRQDAIAEASKAATRKTFGGGNKTLVDSNVQKVMDKGYSEEQATVALKYAKNNVEKALGNLKRRDDRQQRANSHEYEPRESTRDYNNKRGDRKGGNNSSEPPLSKPSTGVSLFDFLENKIPETTSTTTNINTAKSSSYAHNNNSNNNERFENNISSSFRKHDKENSNKSQQWSQYSSSNEQKSSQNYQKNSYNARNNDYRNQEGSSKEHSRDYKDYRHKDSRDGPRDRERDSKYQSHQSSYQSSNYSSKPNTTSTNAYSKSSHSASQKPSSYSTSSNAANNGSQNSYNNSASNKGKYGGNKPEYSSEQKSDYRGQKSDYSGQKHEYGSHKPEYNGSKPDYNNRDGGKNPSKDYNKDYNKDYHKDYNKDYSKDYNKDYNNYSSSGANNSNYNSKYDKPPRSNNNVSSHNNSSSMPHHQHQSHSNDMYQKPPRNIVESMEKMNLKGNHHQSYKSYDSSYESKSSSYPPLVSTNETKQNYSKSNAQSNYPIVGFQSKEGNEQAKNALKTKNIPGNMPQNWQQKQQQQQQQQAPAQQPTPQQVPIPVPVISQQTIKGPPPPFSNNSVPQNAPNQAPTMHSIQQPPPQSFVQHQVMHALPQPTVLATSNPPPTVYHAAPISYPGQIIMQSVQPPQIQQVPPPQQLKIGDLCLAKYWEDGKFYNAKITGNSDSTFVVLFTEYGNAEEVRKTDCVPLISVPTCPTPPINNFVQPPQMGSYRISSQQKMPPPHQQHNYHSQQGMPYKAAAGKNPRRN
ncbi:unnamed protein product [Chironomus riparius]|uniref:Tudor domain-containing protein 3 n=1 Tax=Chironomus riparius TaxID=315576 RepID=A0A9N9RUJ5_9DIPT|nr:unnamed protein product [Chironomus riparius]